MKTLSIFLTSALITTTSFAGPECATGECASKCDKDLSRAAALAGTTAETKGSTAHFLVNEMTCDGCTSKVSVALAGIDGATDVALDHKARSASINFDASKTSKKELVEAINASGFKVSGELVKMNVSGMDCGSCEVKIESKLVDLEGLQSVESVDSKTGIVELIVDPATDTSGITKAIESLGYKVS